MKPPSINQQSSRFFVIFCVAYWQRLFRIFLKGSSEVVTLYKFGLASEWILGLHDHFQTIVLFHLRLGISKIAVFGVIISFAWSLRAWISHVSKISSSVSATNIHLLPKFLPTMRIRGLFQIKTPTKLVES